MSKKLKIRINIIFLWHFRNTFDGDRIVAFSGEALPEIFANGIENIVVSVILCFTVDCRYRRHSPADENRFVDAGDFFRIED
ncbi:MAG: hypothetical protein LBS69_02475 [Prevotellaceae bacterium]|jgi:hypothetical protein|nr:hypothetical protein [Prevotellaceae bacterium]